MRELSLGVNLIMNVGSEKKPNGPGKINGPTTRTKSGVCSWRFRERNPQEKLEDFDVKIGDYSLMRFGDANGL